MFIRKRKAPDFLITQQLDHDVFHPETNEILTVNQHNSVKIKNKPVIVSHIHRSNKVYASYENGKQVNTSKLSKDKTVIGDSDDGLPFMIIARDTDGDNTRQMFSFIGDCVATLMRKYATQLATSKNPQNTIQDLIDEIDKQNQTNIQFNSSISILYEYQNELYCAGYVQGETGLAYRISEDTLRAIEEQYREADEYPLTQEDYRFKQLAYSSSADDKTRRIFVRKINRNDKIYGYSYLINGLRDYRNSDEYKITDGIQICLEDNTLQQKTHDLFMSQCIDAELNKITCDIGDTCTTSYIVIPTEEIQALKRNRIQPRLQLERLKNEFIRKIDIYDKKSKLYLAGMKVFNSIEVLERETNCNTSELIQDLIACNNALTNNNQTNIDALNDRANLAEGRPSAQEKDLGNCLKLLGTIIAAIGACLLPTPVGVGMVIAGGLLVSAGFSIFYTARRQGRSKELKDFASECESSVKQSI